MNCIKMSCQYHKLAGACQFNYIKTCSLRNAHFETIKLVKMVKKRSFIEKTYVVGAHRNCLYEAILVCTNNVVIEIRKTVFFFVCVNLQFSRIMSIAL